MVRIAVVEDEAPSRQLLADYLARYSEENGVSFDVTYFKDGGAIIGDYKPVYDIIFMDIQMTHVDGMSAARAIREVDQEVVLVFITSAAQFAIHGYQVGALSYLMKPLPWFAFSQELSRCLEAVAKRRGASVLLQSGTSTHRIDVADIVYVESIKHRLDVHTVSDTYSITSSLRPWRLSSPAMTFPLELLLPRQSCPRARRRRPGVPHDGRGQPAYLPASEEGVHDGSGELRGRDPLTCSSLCPTSRACSPPSRSGAPPSSTLSSSRARRRPMP